MYVTAITRKLLFKKETFLAGYIKDFFVRMFNEIPAFDASITCPLASTRYVKICIKIFRYKVSLFCSVVIYVQLQVLRKEEKACRNIFSLNSN